MGAPAPPLNTLRAKFFKKFLKNYLKKRGPPKGGGGVKKKRLPKKTQKTFQMNKVSLNSERKFILVVFKIRLREVYLEGELILML